MVLKRLTRKKVFFMIIYIQKEQIAGPENDHATRKSRGHIDLVKAFGFKLLFNGHPPN
jgi:hypothetical protein